MVGVLNAFGHNSLSIVSNHSFGGVGTIPRVPLLNITHSITDQLPRYLRSSITREVHRMICVVEKAKSTDMFGKDPSRP